MSPGAALAAISHSSLAPVAPCGVAADRTHPPLLLSYSRWQFLCSSMTSYMRGTWQILIWVMSRSLSTHSSTAEGIVWGARARGMSYHHQQPGSSSCSLKEILNLDKVMYLCVRMSSLCFEMYVDSKLQYNQIALQYEVH